MQLSLVFPVYKESKRMAGLLADLNSFLQRRWAFPMELIFVVDPATQQQDAKLLREFKPKNPNLSVVILENPRRRGRGPSVLQGLRVARGEFVFVGSVDLNVPLAEYVNALMDFQHEATVDVIIGNRFSSQKPRHGSRPPWLGSFEAAEREKWRRSGFTDPTCPFLAMRSSARSKICASPLRMGRWFYTPAILRATLALGIKAAEKPVLCHDTAESRFGWREAIASIF